MTDLISLSTQIKPATNFSVDGVPYEMYTTDHLSEEQESEVQALFARHAVLSQRLAMCDNVQMGVKLADGMREAQLRVMALLTNLPRDLAERLPAAAKAKLIEALSIEMVSEEDDGGPTATKDSGVEGSA